MSSNTLDHVAQKGHGQEIIKAMVTKFSEFFGISMLKKHRKCCRCSLTHLDATPTFKNRPNTYGPSCTSDTDRMSVRDSIKLDSQQISTKTLHTWTI